MMNDLTEGQKKAQEALDSVMTDPKRTMKQLVNVIGEYCTQLKEDVTDQEEFNKILKETTENAMIEADYISKLSKADLTRQKQSLESTIERVKAENSEAKSILNSIKRRTDYEIKMREIEIEKKKAEDQGFMAMHVAKFHEMQLKTANIATQYLGSGTKSTDFVNKNLGWITLVAIAVMGMLEAFKRAGSVIKETNQGVLLSGGLKGKDWNALGGNAATLTQTMQRFGHGVFTTAEMLDIYNQANDNGAISLARLTLAQKDNNRINQSDIQNLSMKSAIQMKKMSMAVFGNKDMLPEIYKTASMYNLNIKNETQDMIGFVANTSVELGMHTDSMMSIISSLGEKIYMTGQGIVPTEYALKRLGETFKKMTGNNANYTESLMQMAGKQAQSFDILKYMAVTPGHTGDVGKDFSAALKVGPIQQMQTYLKAMISKTGGVERAAFAMPEFRSKEGMDFLKGLSIAKLTGHETSAQMARAVIGTGEASDEQLTKMGADILKGGDVVHAILLEVETISDEIATFASSVVTMIPKWAQNPAARKMIQYMKNNVVESHQLPQRSVAKSIMGSY
jgi:hypothetical protein